MTIEVDTIDKEAKKNAYLYCKLRDAQFALYDEYAKQHGILMKTLLVVNVLYYDDFYGKGSMTQKEICLRTFQSKQTVHLIIRKLLNDSHITIEERKENKREKTVRMTEAGKTYYEKIIRHITWAEDTAMSMLSPEEQKQLIDSSRRFTKNLAKLIHQEGAES